MLQQGDGVRLKVDVYQYPNRKVFRGKVLYSAGDRLTVVRPLTPQVGMFTWDYWCSGSNGEVGVAAHEIEEVT